MAGVFHTKRLVFLPIEKDDEHDKFANSLRSETQFLNNDFRQVQLESLETTKAWIKESHDGKFHLAAYICLPPDSNAAAAAASSSSSSPRQADDAGQKNPAAPSPRPKPIGFIFLFNRGPTNTLVHGRSMIGIDISTAHTGRGYGTEAIEWALWYGFTMLRLHRVEIGYVGWNQGAGRLYRRLGFVPEGTSREALWFMGGWHDLVEMGMLEHEWRDRQRQRGLFDEFDRDKVTKFMGSE